MQNDLKKLAAYSTLGQLSFIVLGIFTFTIAGLDGGIYQILNESLAGAALFMLLGLLYERYGTYEMREYGGLAAQAALGGRHVRHYHAFRHRPSHAEQLCRRVSDPLRLHAVDLAAHHHFWTAVATTGVILSAAYMLTMIQRVFYCDLGPKPRAGRAPAISTRANISRSGRWLRCFLIMGVASPIWMRAIDTLRCACRRSSALRLAPRLHAATMRIPAALRLQTLPRRRSR